VVADLEDVVLPGGGRDTCLADPVTGVIHGVAAVANANAHLVVRHGPDAKLNEPAIDDDRPERALPGVGLGDGGQPARPYPPATSDYRDAVPGASVRALMASCLG
jgi:hypothetical protein